MLKPLFVKGKRKSDRINKLISNSTLDYPVLREFLRYGFITGKKTPFKEIRREHETILNKKEWIKDIDLIKNNFLKYLKKSIEEALGKEKKIGFFLSSGIDSTGLAIILGNYFKKIKVNAYTASFKGNEKEVMLARKISKKYNFNHETVNIDIKKDFELWPKIIKAIGMPIADEASIPLYKMASRAKKDGIKVILVGDGNDELWCGYDHYYFLKKYKKIIPYLPFLGKLLQKTGLPKIKVLGECLRARNWKELLIKRYLFDLKESVPYCWLEQRYGINKSFGLETKFPYLSQELIDLTYNIPIELKLLRENKWLVKEAVAKLDPEILKRGKRTMLFPKKEFQITNIKKVKKTIHKVGIFTFSVSDNYIKRHRKFILSLYLQYLASLGIKV